MVVVSKQGKSQAAAAEATKMSSARTAIATSVPAYNDGVGVNAALRQQQQCRSSLPSTAASAAMAAMRESAIRDEPDDERRTYMARLIIRIESNLRKLGVDTEGRLDDEEGEGGSDGDDVLMMMEGMAILIHESMSISSRNYHSVQHVFDISDGMTDPVPTLAALFHDCVYYHVDGGLSKRQLEKLDGAVKPNDSGCELADSNALDSDRLLAVVASIFGYTPGQQLTPFTGVNEFLSAVIAVRELQPLLPETVLAQIAACIEATIPFRPPSKETGLSPAEELHRRLVRTNSEYELGMSDGELVKAVQRAVVLSNSDVGNFATEDQAWFLDNTWSLLPESNEALRHKFLYTVQEFQFAVFKMHGFFAYFLKPELIFQQFRGVPTDEEMVALKSRAGRNIEIGRRYVAAKLLSVSVLSAFAELTGGDAPISMFMGDLPSRDRLNVERRIESSLPRYDASELRNCDPAVYLLLAEGRKSESAFDVKQSPLAAYLYGYLGDAGLDGVLGEVGKSLHPMNAETANSLLSILPRPAVEVVADNIARVAKSRSELIRGVVDNLPPEK